MICSSIYKLPANMIRSILRASPQSKTLGRRGKTLTVSTPLCSFEVHTQGRLFNSRCFSSQSLVDYRVGDHTIDDETTALFGLLPKELVNELAHYDRRKLTEVVLDVGRKPYAWVAEERHFLGDSVVTEEHIRGISDSLEFGNDNRAGIDGCLHRISAMRSRHEDIIGLTLRVGRFVPGNATMINDLLCETNASILFVGAPGTGKTSIIRDVARVLAEESSVVVVVVDTSCEIGGAGHVPHKCIGLARRMQVSNVGVQAQTMIEAVQNHTPSCLIIDEIGRRSEVQAALTCKERGVRIIASAHGDLASLVRNSELSGLVGGVELVTVGDRTARQYNGSKLRTQRKGPPIFDVIIELDKGCLNEWKVVAPCSAAVDSILVDGIYQAEIRIRRHASKTLAQTRRVTVQCSQDGEPNGVSSA